MRIEGENMSQYVCVLYFSHFFSLVIYYLTINKLEAIQFCQMHTNYSQRKTSLNEISMTKSIIMVRNKLRTLSCHLSSFSSYNIIHKDDQLFVESDMMAKLEQTEDVNVNDTVHLCSTTIRILGVNVGVDLFFIRIHTHPL